MRQSTPSLLGALLLGALFAPQAQGEILDGDFRRASSGKYELRVAGRVWRVQGEVPPELKFIGKGRVRVDGLRGAKRVVITRLVAPKLEELDLDLFPHTKGETRRARLRDRTYSLRGRTHLFQRLGLQGPVRIQGYRLPQSREVVVRTVRAETTGLSMTRVARFIPVPPPIRFTLPRGMIRKGREIWVTQADNSFVTFQTRRGKERLIKRDKISTAPRPRKQGIISTFAR